MESFDSLWFFSNVLTLTNKGDPHPAAAANAIDEDINIIVKQEEKEEASKDKKTDSSSQQNEGLGLGLSPTPRCLKCGAEIAGTGIDEQQVDQWVEYCTTTAKPATDDDDENKVERRKKKKKIKRRSRKLLTSNRKVLGELDLGFYGYDYCSRDLAMAYEETNYGFPSSSATGSQHQQYYCTKMPPLNDGLAMKQHLKSWAHAVACTVR